MKKYLFPLLDPIGLAKIGCASLLAMLVMAGSGLLIFTGMLFVAFHNPELTEFPWPLAVMFMGLYLFGILCSLYICGYCLRVARMAAVEPSDKLPPLRPVGGLLGDGLKSCVLSIPASIPPYFMMMAGMVGFLVALEGVMGAGNHYLSQQAQQYFNLAVVTGASAAFVLVVFAFSAIAYLLFPVLWVHYAVTRDWRALFSWRWAWRGIWNNRSSFARHLSTPVLLYLFWCAAYFFTLGIGGILLSPLLPILMLHACHMVGRFYGECLLRATPALAGPEDDFGQRCG